jgi:hypothetical protein
MGRTSTSKEKVAGSIWTQAAPTANDVQHQQTHKIFSVSATAGRQPLHPLQGSFFEQATRVPSPVSLNTPHAFASPFSLSKRHDSYA